MPSTYKIQKTYAQPQRKSTCSFAVLLRHHEHVHKHPQKEVINIINSILHNNSTSDEQKQELLILVNTIINQNYLQHNNHQYEQYIHTALRTNSML
jgi:hypothetical protein